MKVTPPVFDRSEVKYFHRTDLKASLWDYKTKTQIISVKMSDNIKKSADSKHRTNIFYQITYLVFSPLRGKILFHRCTRGCVCNNYVKFQLNQFSRLVVHREHRDRHSNEEMPIFLLKGLDDVRRKKSPTRFRA